MAAGSANPVAWAIRLVFWGLMAWWYSRNVLELSLAIVVYTAGWHSKVPSKERGYLTFFALLLMAHAITGNSILKGIGLFVVVWMARHPLSILCDFGGPIHVLAQMGQNQALGFLVQLGFSVDAPTFVGKFTALHQAAAAGRDVTCAALVQQYGANVKAKDRVNRTPLHLAASMSSSPTCIKCLVELKCPIDIRANSGATPLHLAAEADRLSKEGLEAILASGADANAQDEAGGSALQRLAFKGNEAAVKMMLEGGAKPDLATKSGATPLHLAALQGFSGVVSVLVAAGASKKAKVTQGAHTGKTPLELAKDLKTRVALGEELSQDAKLSDEILETAKGFSAK
mmetsp:Transcript_34529/g.87190  ORF Transcript_34529/g.87190 Transcript_34529/m.87190 type:complete len:343 (+) Transcript_34529:15-1043(+)|eukprot:CAMPEP_0173428322 /NCGR_PEP_ID=MMETSP1357-20121228/7287_1 /TAXON_ID=77926 /ORGANISM="Hemiselmis rufescens, Strain PCC563" /LENGTH=342 /DNA_ID=CAMNT_0014392309 /DNA_START=15 /DNA_END=1043 /DNA_ORIENTATION=-